MSLDIQASPTTSYAQDISNIAHNRMRCIWIQFVGGVKSLHDFVLCLHEPVFNRNKLQNLSEDAFKQINLAKQNIQKGEDEINAEVYSLILKKQKIETDMEDTNSQIILLSQTIIIKEAEIKKAYAEVQSAKEAVEVHEKKEKKAETKATVAKIFTAAVVVVGGVSAVGVTVLSAGLAAPVAASGVAAAASGVSAIATGVTHSNLMDIRKDLKEKKYILQENQKDLNDAEKRIKDAQNELQLQNERLGEIAIKSTTYHDDINVIAKLKVCVSQCIDFINITLCRVEILRDKKKIEHYKTNLKTIMDEVIKQLLDVSTIKSFSGFIQPVESMAIEMRSVCNQPVYQVEQIEFNNNEEVSYGKLC